VPPYEQSREGYCGPACLKMVLAYYQIDKSEEELVDLTSCTERHGATSEGILEAAQYCGLEGMIRDHSTLENIREMVNEREVPVIVDWFSMTPREGGDGHYSVVIGLDTSNIYLIDPEGGKERAIKRNIFRRHWFDFPGDYLRENGDAILQRMLVLYPENRKEEFEEKR